MATKFLCNLKQKLTYVFIYLFNEPIHTSMKTYKNTIKTVCIDNEMSRPMTVLTDLNVTLLRNINIKHRI